jgi:hypothetical protein
MVFKDMVAATPVTTADPHLVEHDADNPFAFDNPCTAHVVTPSRLFQSNWHENIFLALLREVEGKSIPR